MSRHLHLGARQRHRACRLGQAVLQTQYPTLNALDDFLAGNVEVERNLGREEQRVTVAITAQLEVHDALDHALVDDAEAAIQLNLLVVFRSVNGTVTQVKLEAEHVLSLAHAAKHSHLVTQWHVVVLCRRNEARLFVSLRLRHILETRATLLGQLRAHLRHHVEVVCAVAVLRRSRQRPLRLSNGWSSRQVEWQLDLLVFVGRAHVLVELLDLDLAAVLVAFAALVMELLRLLVEYELILERHHLVDDVLLVWQRARR